MLRFLDCAKHLASATRSINSASPTLPMTQRTVSAPVASSSMELVPLSSVPDCGPSLPPTSLPPHDTSDGPKDAFSSWKNREVQALTRSYAAIASVVPSSSEKLQQDHIISSSFHPSSTLPSRVTDGERRLRSKLNSIFVLFPRMVL